MKLLLSVLAIMLLYSASSYAAAPTPIPEPSTLALMAGGVAIASWIKFRKK